MQCLKIQELLHYYMIHLQQDIAPFFLHPCILQKMLRLQLWVRVHPLCYTVSERNFSIDELLALVKTHEAALSGTAACLAPVGALVFHGKEIKVCDGNPGPNTEKLRKVLQDIQYGLEPDTHGWLTEIG